MRIINKNPAIKKQKTQQSGFFVLFICIFLVFKAA